MSLQSTCASFSLVLTAHKQNSMQELAQELMSTRRTLEKFRVPELVLTVRWADERVTMAQPDRVCETRLPTYQTLPLLTYVS